MAEPIVTGCMLVIGNEILSGRTQDTNLAHLAKVLNELGVRLVEARVMSVGQNLIIYLPQEVSVPHMMTLPQFVWRRRLVLRLSDIQKSKPSLEEERRRRR